MFLPFGVLLLSALICTIQGQSLRVTAAFLNTTSISPSPNTPQPASSSQTSIPLSTNPITASPTVRTKIQTSSNSNVSAITKTSNATASGGNCCYVVQDTITENYWQMYEYKTTASEVNLTSITTVISYASNYSTPVTLVTTNVYPTNASFTFTYKRGSNPISNYVNKAPGPSEVPILLNGTMVEVGGQVMKSPAAFYVYSTLKIITAQPVSTDAKGNTFQPRCAILSSGIRDDFDNVNPSAEAYFGGLDISSWEVEPTSTTTIFTTYTRQVKQTKTTFPTLETQTITDYAYTTRFINSAGSTIDDFVKPTGVEIALTTPFIYAPKRGSEGQDKAQPCAQDSDPEAYGYVPQVIIDSLVANPFYSSQYPGLENCIPGGPSIIQLWLCATPVGFTATVQQTGSDITSHATSYVGKPGIKSDPVATEEPNTPDPIVGESKAPVIQVVTPASNTDPGVFTVPNPPIQTPSPGQFTVPNPPESTGRGLGDIINSIFGNTSPAPPVTIPGATTIPISNAPPGAVGSSSNIDGTPVIILPGPTTIAQPVGQPIVIPAPTTMPVNQAPPGAVGSTTNIGGTPMLVIPAPTTIAVPGSVGGIFPTSIVDGTPVVVIPGATTIPLSLAPPGLVGTTSLVNGVPVIIIPSATNVALPPPPSPFQTTLVNGSPVLIVPGPTTIPLSLAPEGLVGTITTINGVPMIVVPAATNVPLVLQPGQIPAGLFPTSTINGTPMIIFPGATSIPLSLAPPGLVGSTTTINGTPFLVLPGPTTVPDPAQVNPALAPFRTTIINGTPFLVIPSATSIPLSIAPAGLVGSTTTINGTPYLIIPGATSVQAGLTRQAGGITVVGGTTELIITGATTMSYDPRFPVSGRTTVVSGVTMVIISSATTVVQSSVSSSSSGSTTSSKSSSTSTSSSSTAQTSSKTSSSKAAAAPTGAAGKGVLLSAIGAVAGGFVMIVL